MLKLLARVEAARARLGDMDGKPASIEELNAKLDEGEGGRACLSG